MPVPTSAHRYSSRQGIETKEEEFLLKRLSNTWVPSGVPRLSDSTVSQVYIHIYTYIIFGSVI
jgi:hypothetical protein